MLLSNFMTHSSLESNLICCCFSDINQKIKNTNLPYINIQFNDNHLLQPSSFPNGSVCGHLREIRKIDFAPQNNNVKYKKLNVKPVNLKIKAPKNRKDLIF